MASFDRMRSYVQDGAVMSIGANVELSEDETQLKIGYTRLSDEGLYACVAKASSLYSSRSHQNEIRRATHSKTIPSSRSF